MRIAPEADFAKLKPPKSGSKTLLALHLHQQRGSSPAHVLSATPNAYLPSCLRAHTAYSPRHRPNSFHHFKSIFPSRDPNCNLLPKQIFLSRQHQKRDFFLATPSASLVASLRSTHASAPPKQISPIQKNFPLAPLELRMAAEANFSKSKTPKKSKNSRFFEKVNAECL